MAGLAKVIQMDDHKREGPQLEDGFVRIANELFDAILRFRFTLKQQSVLLAIARKTYGYGKKTDDVSASQLGALCGVARNHVTETLHQLVAMNVITMERGEYGMRVGINKHHKQWNSVEKSATSPESGLVPNQDYPSPESGLALVPNRDRSIVPNRDTQKTTFQKTTSKEKNIARSDDRDAFKAFWDAFGKKDGKAKAETAFRELLASSSDPAATIASVMRGAAKEAARRPHLIAKGATPMYAQGWLSQRRFEDESLLAWGEYSPEQRAFLDAYNANIGQMAPKVSEWSEKTAALIDVARSGSWSLDRWGEFWRFVERECEFRWPISLDWLLTRENFAKVKAGQYVPQGSEA